MSASKFQCSNTPCKRFGSTICKTCDKPNEFRQVAKPLEVRCPKCDAFVGKFVTTNNNKELHGQCKFIPKVYYECPKCVLRYCPCIDQTEPPMSMPTMTMSMSQFMHMFASGNL